MNRTAVTVVVCCLAGVLVPLHGQGPLNGLTPAEKSAGWRLLFDGTTTQGWRGYKQDSVPPGWQVVDGALTRMESASDIITRDKFKNFELTLEWNIAPAGNSGIFYRGSEDDDAIYWNAPEMQVLDDAGHPDGKSRLTAAGAAYDMYPSPAGVVKPAGQWNQARLVVKGNHVEHWLNGVKVHYGRNTTGYIGLQDHGDHVAYRNIKIRVLP
ncbi:MAG: DUF1080 domain-containing protein [Gemmatimonadetes bacterium]|nr:MAG: DUF1080 domain-containing protein [Gemmatimonadota bacterium]